MPSRFVKYVYGLNWNGNGAMMFYWLDIRLYCTWYHVFLRKIEKASLWHCGWSCCGIVHGKCPFHFGMLVKYDSLPSSFSTTNWWRYTEFPALCSLFCYSRLCAFFLSSQMLILLSKMVFFFRKLMCFVPYMWESVRFVLKQHSCSRMFIAGWKRPLRNKPIRLRSTWV